MNRPQEWSATQHFFGPDVKPEGTVVFWFDSKAGKRFRFRLSEEAVSEDPETCIAFLELLTGLYYRN